MKNVIYKCYNKLGHFDPEILKASVVKKPLESCYDKPKGLWASPVGKEFYTWEEWCRGEDFPLSRDNTCGKHFYFKLKDNVKVLTIKEASDIVPYLILNRYQVYERYI